VDGPRHCLVILHHGPGLLSHKVIKLSDTLQAFAPEKEITSNVHGVRDNFVNAPAPTSNTVYFVGKLLWAKGLDLLLELEDYYKEWTGDYFDIEIYGTGPDQTAIQRAFHGRRNVKINTDSTVSAQLPRTFAEFRQQPIPAQFRGRVDHGDLVAHKIFVNPSISEVLCTTTAEALAMGKFAIIPYHPSNHFFMQFPNCLPYRDKTEFVANVRWALKQNPQPLTDEQRRKFTWEAATDRLFEAAATTHRAAAVQERWRHFDNRIAKFHNSIGAGMTGDLLRKILGGGPVSAQVQYSLAAQQKTTTITTSTASSSTTSPTTTSSSSSSLSDSTSSR
jgi:digalactosyldiacylglycerol synthase